MSQLPADWKHAVVSPIFKGKGSPNDVTNYRLIYVVHLSPVKLLSPLLILAY